MAGRVFVRRITRLQQRQVVAAQVVQKFQRHFFFVQRVAPHRARSRQIIARLFHNDFRPQHAGRVVKPEIVRQKQPLLGFGDARLVARFRRFFADHAVNQRGFAHVRNAANQHAQRFVDAFAVRHEGAAGGGDFGRGGFFGAVQRDGVGLLAAVEIVQPHGGAFGVGQILLVQDFQLGFALGKLRQQWIFAGGGQPCVQHFNHHIDTFQAVGDGFFRLVHVAGKPLDCHVVCLS